MQIEVPELDLTDQKYKYKTIDLNRKDMSLKSKVKALNVDDLILKIKKHSLPNGIKGSIFACTEGDSKIIINSDSKLSIFNTQNRDFLSRISNIFFSISEFVEYYESVIYV